MRIVFGPLSERGTENGTNGASKADSVDVEEGEVSSADGKGLSSLNRDFIEGD